jgi:hypothetical protein
MDTATVGAEKELSDKDRSVQIPVVSKVKKYIYKLPSGRQLKVIVEDEEEMAAELAVLRPYLIA